MKNIFPLSFLSVFLVLFAFADQAQAYYAPTTGRFINRDPIAEQGGVNVYVFARNDSVNKYDYLGNAFRVTEERIANAIRVRDGLYGANVLRDMNGFEVKYVPDARGKGCDEIILVQVLEFDGWTGDEDWDLDNADGLHNPGYTQNGGRSDNGGLTYVDTPLTGNPNGLNGSKSGDWNIQVCAVCLKCECEEDEYGTLSIKGSSSILDCVSFTFDNKTRKITNQLHTGKPPKEWQNKYDEWKKNRVKDSPWADWENFACSDKANKEDW